MPCRSRSAVAPFRDRGALRRAMAALAEAGFAETEMRAFSRGRAARGGTCDAVGSLLAQMPPAQSAQLARELERGAALLFVKVSDASKEKRASMALLRHSPGSVQVHDFEPGERQARRRTRRGP